MNRELLPPTQVLRQQMRYLPRITLLLIAANLHAQEAGEQAAGSDQASDAALDPIAAEVFADDLVPPAEITSEITQEITPEIAPEMAPEMTPLPEQELPPEASPAAPIDEQVVPVAEEPETVDSPAADPGDEVGPTLPPDASDEEQLMYQYSRYLQLIKDRVYDEADTVAKRVVELTLKVKGPKSTEFSKALINLAIVQHYTGQYDAAQQNFMSSIEIIETNEDRLNGQLVNPLKGLGASQLDGGRPDLASETFARAVHVTHVNEGPHNLQQVEILESLAEANLRLGSVEGAREIQEIIYGLYAHAYDEESVEFVPSLLRRADWQHRAGFINDERVTLRRAIRIIEMQFGKDDLQLVEPLIRLGRTYFYFDTSGTQTGMQTGLTAGEIHFRRAMRIATEHPSTDWLVVARASLALGDYYMFEGNTPRAFTVYREAWNFLSESDERLDTRHEQLEQAVLLRERPLPKSVTPPGSELPGNQPAVSLQGSITLAFDISANGNTTNLRIVNAQPVNFDNMQRTVHREMRSRLYRPRFVDAEPVATEEQLLVHRFSYTQADLDAQQLSTEAEVEVDIDTAKQDPEQT